MRLGSAVGAIVLSLCAACVPVEPPGEWIGDGGTLASNPREIGWRCGVSWDLRYSGPRRPLSLSAALRLPWTPEWRVVLAETDERVPAILQQRRYTQVYTFGCSDEDDERARTVKELLGAELRLRWDTDVGPREQVLRIEKLRR